MKRTLFSVFNSLTVYFLTTGLVLAENKPDCVADKCLPNPLSTTSTIFELVQKVINWLSFTLGPILVTAMVIIGAFQMLLAKGDPKAFETGKKTILYTVIGYAILVLGSVLTDIVSDFLSVKK